MSDTTLILISALVAFMSIATFNMVIVVLALRRAREDSAAWRSVVEQALVHIKSTTATESVNATSALEYNRKVIEEGEPEVAPVPPAEQPVLRDRVTGKEYEVIGGDIHGVY